MGGNGGPTYRNRVRSNLNVLLFTPFESDLKHVGQIMRGDSTCSGEAESNFPSYWSNLYAKIKSSAGAKILFNRN